VIHLTFAAFLGDGALAEFTNQTGIHRKWPTPLSWCGIESDKADHRGAHAIV